MFRCWRNTMMTVALCCAVQAQAVFMNDTTNLTVVAGATNIVVAQTGTGVVDKAGGGLLIVQDAGLFNGVIRLREGALLTESSGSIGTPRPESVLNRATFHVDASDATSFTTNAVGAVTEWRDTRGAGYMSATPPDSKPLWLEGALNGLPVVDFGPMAFHCDEVRGMHWSRELTNSVRSIFWVLGSQFGGGFLLGASDTYHFHRALDETFGVSPPLIYMYPETAIVREYLPDDLWAGQTQIDRQLRDGRTTGLSGAFHLISIVATNTASSGATAGRFANDRHFDSQSGGQSLAEAVVFEEILSESERDALEAYLTDKWFRGPDLRFLELAGTGTVASAESGQVSVNMLAGAGQLNAVDAVRADTVKLAGAMDLAGAGSYAVGLLRGSGTLTAAAPVRIDNIGLYKQDLMLAVDIVDDEIGTLYGEGALTLNGGILFERILVGANINITNDGTELGVAFLGGRGTLNVAECGALAVDEVRLGNQNLTINSGTNAVSINTLSGDGMLLFNGAGAVTIGDVSEFTGTLYMDDCGPVRILGPSGDTVLNGLTVVGTADLSAPGGTLSVGMLHGRGILNITNVFEAAELSLTADLTVNDTGTGPLIMERIEGPGSLTINRPYYAPVINMRSGAQTVTIGLSNRLERVSGGGRLIVPDNAFTIDNLALDGTVTFSNEGQPLTVAQMSGSGRLTASGSELSLSAVTVMNTRSVVVDAGSGAVTVDAFFGYGAFRKAGSGAFTFPVPVTLRNLVTEGGALNPVRVSPATLPASVVPAFWVDASQADTLQTNTRGDVTQWWDVRKETAGDSWMHAYSESSASAPGLLAASANGLPIVDFGPYGSGHFLLWSSPVYPVRSFFMAIGTHEGGGYLLGCSTVNDFIRFPGKKDHRTPLWNYEKLYTRFGRSYVDGELTAYNDEVPFNGGYQVFSFVDDTTLANNPELQRGRADQFARYMTITSDYTSGQRLGEVVICTNEVTETEREAIESYLTSKWVADIRRLEVVGETSVTLAQGETLSVDVTCGAGRLVKNGAGKLKISNAAMLTGGVTVEAGQLAFARTDRVQALNPVFHVDADADNGSVMTNHYGYVTNWVDVSFNGRYAYATNVVNDAPNLLLNAMDGKSVIDFNYFGRGATSLNTTRSLVWNEEITTIRSAFWMLGSQLGGGFLLGHSEGYDFHRTTALQGDSYAPGLFASSAAAGVRSGEIFVDGTRLNSFDQPNVLNGSYQLVQLITTDNAAANQFSRDRASSWQCGGQRLGEVALYDYALTEKERMNMEAFLSAKWFGDLRRIELRDGTTFDAGDGSDVVTVATFTGSGTVARQGAATLRLVEAAGFSGILETRLDRLDVSRKEPSALPAPNPVLWLDASRPCGVAVNGSVVTNIRDFSANNLPIGFEGGNPELLVDELNGHPVIDLGPAVAQGKRLTFDGARAPMLSAVVVHGSQEGGGCFLGAESSYPFYREYAHFHGTANPYTPVWHPYSSDIEVRQGWTYLDGEAICGVRSGFKGGYGLFTTIVKPREPYTTLTYIAGDRKGSQLRGGLRFGELLLFDRVLSDAERQQTEAYLAAKWFGRGTKGYAAPTLPVIGRVRSLGGALHVEPGRLAVIGQIDGADSVSVVGGGKLALTSGGAAPAANYSVSSGALTLSPSTELKATLPVTDSLAFWADASKTDSLTLKSGGSAEVLQWADARGAGYPAAYAYADPDQRYTNTAVAVDNRIADGIAITPPTLMPAGLNGLPVVDFGAYNSTRWMLWDTTVTGIRSVFWVIGSQSGGGHLLPGSDDSNYFLRGVNHIEDTPRVLWADTPSTQAVRDGSSRIDGASVNGLKSGLNGSGYQLVSVVTASDAPRAGAFAADRPGRDHPDGTRCGGQRLAEVLVYTRALSDPERAEVEAYLTWKWFGRGTPGTSFAATPHNGASVALAPDAELILNGVAPNDVTVTGDGYVADGAVPPTVYQLTGARVFNQGLVLADGAKMFIDYDAAQPSAGRVNVSGGLTVEGGGQVVARSVVNWTSGKQIVPLISYDTIEGGSRIHGLWSGSGAPFGHNLKPGWKPAENLIDAQFTPSGTLMILR